MTDYLRRKIIPESRNLREFLSMLSRGDFLIPTFQRSFVWNPEHIIALWDSIYRFYPVGSILYWETHTRLHVHRRLGGFLLPSESNGKKPHMYILDGQQRATSLFISYFGGTGRIKDETNFNYTLYFDLTKANFFFEKDLYKRRWDAAGSLLLRLKDIETLQDDYATQLSGTKGYHELVPQNFKQIKHVLQSYNIQLICLRGFDMASVCDVFERINQGGMRLENMDILIARNFHNYPTVIEEDFES